MTKFRNTIGLNLSCADLHSHIANIYYDKENYGTAIAEPISEN